jgi:DNA polymerase V
MSSDKLFYPAYGPKRGFLPKGIEGARANGFVATTNDHVEPAIDLNEELIGNKSATFFMRVNSDIMRDAGIFKEDIVIVDRSLKAANGKVIIAILSGELLIRRFEKSNNKIRLLADTVKLAPINIDATCEDFAIWGVVTYVIHKP